MTEEEETIKEPPKAPKKLFLASQGNYDLFFESPNGRISILYISTTQEILEEKYETVCRKILTANDRKQVVFLNIGNLHYAAIVTADENERIETTSAVRRQLQLFHDLLRFRIKLSLNAAPLTIQMSQVDTRKLVRPLTKTLGSLARTHQSILVQGIECVELNSWNREDVVKTLKAEADKCANIVHAIVFVGMKVAGMYSKPLGKVQPQQQQNSSFTLIPRDLLCLIIYAQSVYHLESTESRSEAQVVPDSPSNTRADGKQQPSSSAQQHMIDYKQTLERTPSIPTFALGNTSSEHSSLGEHNGSHSSHSDSDDLHTAVSINTEDEHIHDKNIPHSLQSLLPEKDLDLGNVPRMFPQTLPHGISIERVEPPLLVNDQKSEPLDVKQPYEEELHEELAQHQQNPEDRDEEFDELWNEKTLKEIPESKFDYVYLRVNPQHVNPTRCAIYSKHNKEQNITLLFVCTPSTNIEEQGDIEQQQQQQQTSGKEQSVRTRLVDAAQGISDELMSISAFLKIKAEFPNRVRERVIAPRIVSLHTGVSPAQHEASIVASSAQQQPSPVDSQYNPADVSVEFIRERVWDMVSQCQEHRDKGYFEVGLCSKNVQYWFKEWFEDENGNEIKAIATYNKFLVNHLIQQDTQKI